MTRSCADVPETDLVSKVMHSTRLADHPGPMRTKPCRTLCAMRHASSSNSRLLGRGGEGFTCPRALDPDLLCSRVTRMYLLHWKCEQACEVAFDAWLLQQGQRRRLRSSSLSPKNCVA